MKLLDLFCGAGGAAMGYYRAGFTDITGVDIRPMPRYPFRFIQGDALEYLAEHGEEYDAIHASPPCQGYSVTQKIHGMEYPKLIDHTRFLLEKSGRPWIIENVSGAPLRMPTVLCGMMFGLRVVRHRLFESNFWFLTPFHPIHNDIFTNSSHGYSSFANGATHITVAGHNFDPKDGAMAMGIGWMDREELAEAIPPAYTEFIGRQLIAQLEVA